MCVFSVHVSTDKGSALKPHFPALRLPLLGIAAMSSEHQLTPFDIGQIKAHMHHGLGDRTIATLVMKRDGTAFGHRAIADAMSKLKANPQWRGERKKKARGESARQRRPSTVSSCAKL